MVFTKPVVQDVLQIPEITITARAPMKAKRVDATPAFRDISEMRCDEWRELSAGSGRVQTCE
jgi:hypothetical protein